MKIEISDLHQFRNALVLQEGCARRLADMAAQLAGPLNPEELAAAKDLVKGAWRLIEGLFESQGMEIRINLDMDLTLDSINKLASA